MSKKRLFPKLVGTKIEGFEPLESVDELRVEDMQVGDGEVCREDSVVAVHYTGALCASGIVFESSLDNNKPAELDLYEVIEGWQEGIPGMRTGGRRRLIIPATKAYGNSSPSKAIPRNSDLVFDIQLVAVK